MVCKALRPARTAIWVVPGERCRAEDAGLGIYVADLPTQSLPPGTDVRFSLHWTEGGRWEGTDYTVAIRAPADVNKV